MNKGNGQFKDGKVFSTKLGREMREAFEAVCGNEDRTPSQFIRRLIREDLEKRNALRATTSQ